MMKKISLDCIPDSEWYTGIDVGQVNLGISFFNGHKLISYRATPNGIYKYDIEHETPMMIDFKYDMQSPDDLKTLYAVLSFIPEFYHTKRIVIEEQLPFHNADMLRIDGAIHGFLSSKYSETDVRYLKPNSRAAFTKKYLSRFPDAENTFLPLTKIKKEAKKDPMKIIGYEFPDFYSHILMFVPDKKIDDICDSALYAFYAFLEKYKNAFENDCQNL